jgi:hypothetical protein
LETEIDVVLTDVDGADDVVEDKGVKAFGDDFEVTVLARGIKTLAAFFFGDFGPDGVTASDSRLSFAFLDGMLAEGGP